MLIFQGVNLVILRMKKYIHNDKQILSLKLPATIIPENQCLEDDTAFSANPYFHGLR